MKIVGSQHRRTLAWSSYDVASSTFAAIVPPYFGLYFLTVVGSESPRAVGYWGLVAAAAIVLAGVLAPIAGAFADRTGRWLAVLAGTTALCVSATLLLPTAASGHAIVACATFIAAQVGYAVATSLYDSLVVEVAPSSRRGLASGLGWAIGLCGGVVAIVTALAIVRGVPASAQVRSLGIVFIATGLLFGLLAVPALLRLRGLRAPAASRPTPGSPITASVRDVLATVRHWREHRHTLRVVASFFLINDVLVTLQFFIAVMLSVRFGLTVESMLKLSLVFHAIAIPSTVVAGALADRWGGRRMVVGMSVILGAALLLLAVSTQPWVPLVAVALLGLVFGSLQAVFRSLYASLVESDRTAEFFGFNSLAGRLSAGIGPVIFGAAAAALGSQALALLILLVPLAAGVALLLRRAHDDTTAPLPGEGSAGSTA